MVRYRHTDTIQNNIFLPITLRNQIVERTLPTTIQFIIDKIDSLQGRNIYPNGWILSNLSLQISEFTKELINLP